MQGCEAQGCEAKLRASSFTRYAFLPVLLLSFCFLFWPSKMENSRAAAASGRGGGRGSAASSFSFFSFLSSLFYFFYFGRRKWRNPELLRRRGEAEAAELLRRRSRLVGEEEDSPTQNDVVLGWFDFFLKSKHPKTTSF